ncbi:MAG: PP2C family protein-serine/threonine phosphatase [Candidatus Geothermincolia bacterium]
MESKQAYWTIGPTSGTAAHVGSRGYKEGSFILSDYFERASRGFQCFMEVADGFGGPELGAAASRRASEMVHSALDPSAFESEDAFRPEAKRRLVESVLAVNKQLYEASATPGREGMGTTLTCAVIDSENAFVAHVGNARAYVLTARGIRQVTSDHIEITADGGKRLTRALGVGPSIDADILRVPLRPGEVFFICSHGLYSTFTAEEITGALMSIPDLQGACDWLVEAAVARGASGDAIITAWRVPGDVPVVAAPPQPQPTEVEAAPAKSGKRRWLVAIIAVLLLLGGAAGGWAIGSIWYQNKGATKTLNNNSSTARFAAGDVAVVDTTGRPEACYLTDYPGGPDQTRLYNGWKVRIISQKFSNGEQWYRVEVMDGGLATDGKEGYVQESFLVESR